MRCKGTPTYTQFSVAWPTLPQRNRVTEEVHVSFAARGGGTYAEFNFRWHHVSSGADFLRVECFADGLDGLLDERTLDLLGALRKLPEEERDLSPEKLIEWLRAAGFTPSAHHLHGLLERERVSDEERDWIDERMRYLARRGVPTS